MDKSGVVVYFSMTYQSETELLAQRLDAIRSEKAVLMKKVDELTADEQRINYALDVFRSVIGERAISGVSSVQLNPVVVSATGTVSGSSAATGVVKDSSEDRHRTRQTLESLILEAFAAKDGMTSVEVVSMLNLVSDAKRESIMSTLSRMAGKGLLRREGKLYFRGTKSEGPEVGTTEPSIATMSGEGQPTSGAEVDEEGDKLF